MKFIKTLKGLYEREFYTEWCALRVPIGETPEQFKERVERMISSTAIKQSDDIKELIDAYVCVNYFYNQKSPMILPSGFNPEVVKDEKSKTKVYGSVWVDTTLKPFVEWTGSGWVFLQ